MYRSSLLKLFFLSLLPLVWGLCTAILIHGGGFFAHVPYTFVALIALLALTGIFYSSLEFARKNYRLKFFEYDLKLPPWLLLVAVTATGLIVATMFKILGIPYQNFPALISLITGVGASACIEELLARTAYVKFPMTTAQALFFNLLSSLAVTYMHVGFEESRAPLLDYLFLRGYYVFSFSLGLIAYKTKRIELCILLHMLSNLFNYTLPVLVIGESFKMPPSLIASLVMILALAGCYSLFNRDSKELAK